jgi:hypothetical protein
MEDKMHRNSIVWGILLVLLGGLFLLDNLGFLPRGINIWGIFWPLLLIGLGINALWKSTNRGRAAVPEETLRLPLESAQRALVKIAHGAGELTVDDRAAPGELVNGLFGGGVEKRTSLVGDETQVELRLPADNFTAVWPGGVPGGFRWTVGLSPEIPLRLELEVGASRNRLDLSRLQVRELRLSTGASETILTFPERAGQTNAWMKSGAASVEATIPAGVAARIRMHGALASMDVDTQRFPRVGDEYLSPEYATAENRVDLDVETGVGSVRIR